MLLTCALLEGAMDILLLVGLIALNGIFAMSEIALVAAKSGRLKMMAEDNAPAALALELKKQPYPVSFDYPNRYYCHRSTQWNFW